VSWIYVHTRPDPDRLWVRAELAFRAGRTAEASKLLERIETLRPRTAGDRILRAQLASVDGHIDLALAALSQVPGGDPLSGQALLMAGRLERARKRVRAAESYFLRALQADPKLIDGHKELVYIYGYQLRRREIDAEFRALARLTPLSHHDLFTWALTHFSSWNPDVAIELQAFVAADPSDRQSRLALARLLLDQPGQGGRVLRLLEVLPASDPDALPLRVGLALNEGRPEVAESMLSRASDDYAGLARFRGRLAMARRDPATAVNHFRRAVSSDLYDRVSTFDLARALALKGDQAAAEPLLTTTKRLNELYNLVTRVRSPDRENQSLDLNQFAAACEAAGLTDEARHWFALAVSRDPFDSNAQAGLFRLGRGKQ
jgi:tetratricopeptide (TPR) repeat protein